jgi:pimeloyl-ACP methyl ester carboxylesterase
MLQTATGFAEVHGTQLYYDVAGSGRPIVLLHEGIADHRMWDAQVAAFAPHYRVIRYDARGFGRSPMPPEAFYRHEDLQGLLEALGIDHAILLGASMGGAAAIDAALAYPEMVDALVLMASALGGYDFSDETKQKWAEIDAAYERDGVAAAVELELQMWVDGPFRTPEQVDPAVRELVREMNMGAYAGYNESASEQELEPPAISRLGEIRVPTLIVVGDLDVPEIVARATLLEQGIAGARKVVVPGTAHVLNMERPEEFNRLVLDFLES